MMQQQSMSLWLGRAGCGKNESMGNVTGVVGTNDEAALVCLFAYRSARPSGRHALLLALSVVCFMLPWQFAQFALLTQIMAVFATYALGFVGSHKMKIILLGHAVRT